MNRIILASQNKGKLKELYELILPLGYEVISMEDAGFMDEIKENGASLHENAYIKAKAIYDNTKGAVLADDSGLFIDALDGEPGVFSARYAGEHKNSEDNIDKVLLKLDGIENRKAHFGAVLCYIDNLGNDHYFEGRVHGNILQARQGNEGFGYDPIFMPDGYEKSFAELSNEIKNSLSHRAVAMKGFVKFMRNINQS